MKSIETLGSYGFEEVDDPRGYGLNPRIDFYINVPAQKTDSQEDVREPESEPIEPDEAAWRRIEKLVDSDGRSYYDACRQIFGSDLADAWFDR